MEKKLNIYFNTENKKTYHIALSHPKENLSKATVEAVAQKIVDTRVFNNMNWFAKKDYFDSHRVVVMETPERKYYYEVTGVKVVHEDTNLYQIPTTTNKKDEFISLFKNGSRNWLENTKISGEDNMTVFATCRLDDVSLRTLVLARQVPDKELKEFLEKNKELLNS